MIGGDDRQVVRERRGRDPEVVRGPPGGRAQFAVSQSEGDELRDAMLAKDDADLGWALGLGRKISTIPFREIVESEAIRCEQLGPHNPEWTRVIYDDEREVFIAVSDSGIRAAPMRVVWDSPSTPTRVIELGPVVPWTRGIDMRRAIDQVARERRRTYKPCVRCGRPIAPEHRSTEEEGLKCHTCMEREGTVF